jgi:MFS family permease
MQKSAEVPRKMPSAERLWNADFLKIGLIAALFSLAYQMFYTAFPLYLQSFGANATLIGAATGGFTVAALAARPVVGHFLDKSGRQIVLLIGMAVTIICAVGLAAIPSITAIVILRVIQGSGIASVSTANGTIASDVIPQKRLAEGLGYYGVFFTIATAFGPALALALIKDNNYSPVMISNIVILALTFLFALTMRYEKRKAKPSSFQEIEASGIEVQAAAEETAQVGAVIPAPEESSANGQTAALLPAEYTGIWKFVEKSSLLPALISAVLSLAAAAPVTFLVPYAVSRGFENIPIFFTFQALAALFSRLFGGRITTRFGPLAALVPGLILIGISFICIAPLNSLALLIFAAIIYGLGFGLCYPVLNALAITAASPSRRGVANSTYACSFDIGMGFGSTAWGIVVDAAGYPPIFIAAGILAFLCLGLSVALYGRKRT